MSAALGSDSSIASAGDPLVGLPYRTVQLLGAGGMGEVFLAEHRELGKLCVVKILHARFANDERLADRVRLEARALGRIRSPFIVSVSGAGITADRRPFIVMEYLEGHTVAEEIAQRGHLPLPEALKYACELLQALEVAHAAGIVHRDIKPGNLFLCDAPDGSRTLKVVDFGLTRIMPDAPAGAPQPLAVPTDTGIVVGTPRYVSPEGARAQPVDHRADLYGAALMLYLMVAGRGPFDHIRSEPMVLSAHASERPQPPSHFAKQAIPPELDRVLLYTLRKDPAARFQTAAAFREQLEQIKEQLEPSETADYDAAWFADPPRSPHDSAPRIEPLAIEQASLPAENANDGVPVAIPNSGAFPKHHRLALQAHARRPITTFRVTMIFLCALAVAAAISAGLVALLQVAR
jgi:eukaryotic-like serine/threonine-protein kinase